MLKPSLKRTVILLDKFIERDENNSLSYLKHNKKTSNENNLKTSRSSTLNIWRLKIIVKCCVSVVV